jgi:uncharacterized membrane protein
MPYNIYTGLDDPLATGGTFPTGINAAGQIVGYYNNSAGFRGFLLSEGAYTSLNDFIATGGTQAFGINNAGQIVGSYGNGSGIHGFLLAGGTYTTLEDPSASGFNGTVASGINGSGQIVGSYSTGGFLDMPGFLLRNGIYTTLDDPFGAFGTVATGINNAGQIVGYYRDATGSTHGLSLASVPTNPPPPVGTTADMISARLEHAPAVAGQYEIYDIGNNAILAGYSLGQVGTDWGFVTLGGFNGGETTDMLLRNSSTGGFEVYDISNNNIMNAAFRQLPNINAQR